MTDPDRAELQVAAVIGAVLGGVTGYLIAYLAGRGGWPKILIWALMGAVVFTAVFYCLRDFRSRMPPLADSRHPGRSRFEASLALNPTGAR
jgi:hypothetical protein